jgi:hypothetical protein
VEKNERRSVPPLAPHQASAAAWRETLARGGVEGGDGWVRGGQGHAVQPTYNKEAAGGNPTSPRIETTVPATLSKTCCRRVIEAIGSEMCLKTDLSRRRYGRCSSALVNVSSAPIRRRLEGP